jgi:hypothetical protein
MGFVPISIKEYIKKHLENNPSEREQDLRNRLKIALADFNNGVKCFCGNDIWVIGSASVGNSCFTCITGESTPSGDFEIDTALLKTKNIQGQRHIDEIPPLEINGFFNDEGYEINTDLIPKPSLCITCLNNDDPNEEPLCNMTRHDQRNESEFKCFAYRKNV